MKKHMPGFLLILVTSISVQAQLTVAAQEGYSPQVGVMVSMLDDLKGRITRMVKDLNQEETDFLMDDQANRIGALILHLAATEVYYQVYTFEERNFNKEEEKKWDAALNLGNDGREELKGKPISYYLGIWDEVRTKTKEQLKAKDDDWFAKNAPGNRMTNHWAWFHVMEHQSNHMGQVAIIRKRML